MEAFHIIIPARYASTRLPGKPLLDVAGKSLIQRVVECARKSEASSITVATDDERILQAVRAFGGEAVMTQLDHPSGSDRIAEASSLLGLNDSDIIVNVQGDEPDMPAELINQVAQILVERPLAQMATASAAIESQEQADDPSIVKVVVDKNDYALYFSRALIPYIRDSSESALDLSNYRRHLGIYAYRSDFISQFAKLPMCELEQLEKLEQLRVLWSGEKIACAQAIRAPGPGVDTEEDLARVRSHFS